MTPNILNREQISKMRIAGEILSSALNETIKYIKPGVSTFELDALADDLITKKGGRPSFKGYEVHGTGKYPYASCVSVNDEIVHGLPSDRIVKDGDVVSIGLGAEYQGIHSDMAVTIVAGSPSADATRLAQATKESLAAGIEMVKIGNTIGDIGHAIESVAIKNGLGIVREYVGHGIGTKLHLPPAIPNYGKEHTGEKIVEGMALAIEPMFTLGADHTQISDDGWTVKTLDQSLAAHFEHTVVVVNGKPEIMTLSR